jgi:stress response protein YsnF
MTSRTMALCAAALVAVAACGKKDNEQTTADTMLTKGTDTAKATVQVPVPTTDTVVKTTTTKTDTIKGKAADSTKDKMAKTKMAPTKTKKP